MVNILAREHMVETIVTNVAKSNDDLLQDLVQEIYLSLLEKEEDRIVELYKTNNIRYFITRMVTNNIHSKNSPWYCKIKSFSQNANEITKEIKDIEDE